MASVIAGGLFNAISFAGAGYLFSKLNEKDYEKEIRRHNLALESLARAKQKWYENEIKQRDKVLKLRQEIADANVDMKRTNDALKQIQSLRTIRDSGREFRGEPTLNDFYKPSAEMEHYKYLFSGGLGFISSVAAGAFLL
jgi:hypothetical protein